MCILKCVRMEIYVVRANIVCSSFSICLSCVKCLKFGVMQWMIWQKFNAWKMNWRNESRCLTEEMKAQYLKNHLKWPEQSLPLLVIQITVSSLLRILILWSGGLKDNSPSACQEIPHLLQNPKIDYRIHKSLSLNPILSQTNPVSVLTTLFTNIHFNIASCTLCCIDLHLSDRHSWSL
jgi:hypothetical protein